MSARDEIANSLWYGLPSTCDEHAQELAEGMMDAYAAEVRAETLREAADAIDSESTVSAAVHASTMLRRMAGKPE